MAKKKILLIAPRYFGYYKIISEELEKNEYLVDFIPDANDGTVYIFAKNNEFTNTLYVNFYKKKVLKLLEKNNYDIIFVIAGKLFSKEIWSEILSHSNGARKILSQWDSLRVFNYEQIIPLFDKVLSFDSYDVENHPEIKYLPLFYSNPTNEISQSEKPIDLLFVGIWHNDRLQVLQEIYTQAHSQGLNVYFRVYYPLLPWLWIRMTKKGDYRSDFIVHKKIKPKDMNMLYERAQCILDIHNPFQHGLTMRTIECIGADKKLLTSNSKIKSESFYNPQNIQIFDRLHVNVDFSFLYNERPYLNKEEYHISNWIKHILE